MRKSARSTAFSSSGFLMLALRKKNGSAKSNTTKNVSRSRLNSPMGASADGHFFEQLDVVERLAATEHDRADRIVSDHHGQPRLLTQKAVHVLEQRAATGEHDALVHDVRRELRR